ncbi:peptide chain release factor N(5)-glutamine methyltransferase [Kovacikia minuta CCNUW1]|uniref:peptide chain release factor N(5)-glutamine methyltransferase n=1 Tax=Kovacikia minuta TaxID=2931930 RepID=UPI001CCC034F|nr:peptide chain release factor N(5)-glutamine methyltransferase [Kovacikia minuta]UBF27789.1 peptide chain release factor N(5)-glutamine methyltransferase [Kovacikia minuta CCNUW1]
MSDANIPFNQLSSQVLRREFSVAGQELWEWRKAAQSEAIAAHIPPQEIDWFLQELAGLDRLSLRLESFRDRATIPLKHPFWELKSLWQRRLNERIPVQYLTGIAPWRQFCLKVAPAVLIPRPETECLIDLAIAAVEKAEARSQEGVQTSKFKIQTSSPTSHSPLPTPLSSGHWADLGTGSGAIALGLATAFPEAVIHAVDCSPEALAIARANARTYQLEHRIQFYQGSWLQPLEHLKGKLSCIISNPPYIPSQLVLELQPEVTRHEPHLALNGGPDGLDAIRHLVATAPAYLHADGILLFEMMAGQASSVTQLLQQQGSYYPIQIFPDLAGIERFALAYRS